MQQENCSLQPYFRPPEVLTAPYEREPNIPPWPTRRHPAPRATPEPPLAADPGRPAGRFPAGRGRPGPRLVHVLPADRERGGPAAAPPPPPAPPGPDQAQLKALEDQIDKQKARQQADRGPDRGPEGSPAPGRLHRQGSDVAPRSRARSPTRRRCPRLDRRPRRPSQGTQSPRLARRDRARRHINLAVIVEAGAALGVDVRLGLDRQDQAVVAPDDLGAAVAESLPSGK